MGESRHMMELLSYRCCWTIALMTDPPQQLDWGLFSMEQSTVKLPSHSPESFGGEVIRKQFNSDQIYARSIDCAGLLRCLESICYRIDHSSTFLDLNPHIIRLFILHGLPWPRRSSVLPPSPSLRRVSYIRVRVGVACPGHSTRMKSPVEAHVQLRDDQMCWNTPLLLVRNLRQCILQELPLKTAHSTLNATQLHRDI